eukprot:NODE_7202_length_266_cov_206.668203_g6589_i0.p1 GENE.NODE_7202_length_266_cov_206.668203_g6589_i0~~NODE_7202_length_266_cov_206.668203_g6589_i0.p1  ORF type:complete len:72 (+),score=7.51 NODE_7202_length_266_cov_206.668203_g6589_i0:32-247(+)
MGADDWIAQGFLPPQKGDDVVVGTCFQEDEFQPTSEFQREDSLVWGVGNRLEMFAQSSASLLSEGDPLQTL